MLVPALLKPKLWALKNRWRGGATLSGQLGRDIVLLFLSLLVMYGVYHGTHGMLLTIRANHQIVHLSPEVPLGLLLMLLMAILLFSCSIAGIGALVLGNDLDLILSSPIGTARLMISKAFEVISSSAWLATVFGLPILIAFGRAYDQGLIFYAQAILVLIPYFLIPAVLGMLAVTAFTRLVPVAKTREILLLIAIAAIVCLYIFTRAVNPGGTSFTDIDDILRILSIVDIPNSHWIPSHWAARALSGLLEQSYSQPATYIALLYAFTGFLLSLLYIAIETLHRSSYSMAHGARTKPRLHSERGHRILAMLTPFVPGPYRGIIVREYKTFSRDMTQTVQLMLLLGLCTVYLYNFRVLHSAHALPGLTMLWWQSFLVFANIAMGGFVITAVCARFAFPSLSLEGDAYWLLRTAPISTRGILRAKFWCWLIPVATISSIIFSSGAFAINAIPNIILINALASWIICYGIVGLAIGLGAFFANFSWEHSSQLSTSFGSLLFMVLSIILILVNMIPAALLIGMRTLRVLGYEFSNFEWYLGITSAALWLVLVNYIATQKAIDLGARALEEKMLGITSTN